MFSANGAAEVGTVLVHKVDYRGFTPEELADQALNRIIYVGDQTHPAIRDQAQAFREHIRQVLVSYMHRAVESHNTTLANRLRDAGHPELVKLLEA
jgi:cephalosporin hydroxylase